jgi:hypothetical protein
MWLVQVLRQNIIFRQVYALEMTVKCILEYFPNKGDLYVTETDQLYLNVDKPATNKKYLRQFKY